MFCPNCGTKVEIENQKFCQNCGHNLSQIYKTSQVSDKDYKHVSNVNQTSKQSYSVPVISQIKPKVKNIPGPYSKKCLGFGIPSVGIGLVALYIGFIGFTIAQTFWAYGYSDPTGLVFWPTLLVIHIIALIFGITSRANSRIARNVEPINDVEKTGNVFGTIGIIINAILICVVLFIFLFLPI